MERKLTTEQMEILMLLNEITEYVEKEDYQLTVPLDEIIVSNNMKDDEEFYEITDLLENYGYIDEDYVPTREGKQYIKLFMEYAEEQKEQTKPVINNNYSLISIKELKLSLVGSLLETNNELIGNVNMIISNIFKK